MKKILLSLLCFGGCANAAEPQLDHTFGPSSMAFSPDNKRLAVAGSDGVKIYDSATGKVLETKEGGSFGSTSLAWSPDGKSLAVGGLGATDELKGQIILWRANQPVKRWFTDSSNVTSLRFSNDGRYLWSATAGDVFGERANGSVRIWDTRTGKLLKTLANYHGAWHANFVEADTDKNVICRVSVTDKEQLLNFDAATGTKSQVPVKVREFPSYRKGNKRAQISTYSGADYSRFLYTVTDNRGKRIVSQDMGNVWGSTASLKFPYVAAVVAQRYFPGYEARLKIWKIDANTWKLREIGSLNRTLAPTYLTSTSDGKNLFIQSNKGIIQLDAHTLSQRRLWPESKESTVQFPSKTLSVSQSGTRLFNNRWLEMSGGKPREVVSSEKLSGVISSVSVISPDGKLLVAPYKAGVAIYDERGKALDLGVQAFNSPESFNQLHRAKFSPDGQKISIIGGQAGSSTGTRLYLFNRNGKVERRIQEQIKQLKARDAVFSPDNSRMFVASLAQEPRGKRQIVISRFNLGSDLKQKVSTVANTNSVLKDDVVRDLIISPDGKTLALSAFVTEGNNFGPRVLLFDADTLRQKTSLPLSNGATVLQIGKSIAFDANNNLVVLRGQRLDVWNLKTRTIEKSRLLS